MRDFTLSVHHPAVAEDEFSSLCVATQRASTIVFDNAEAYATRGQRDLDSYSYGMHGTPTQRVLEAQLTALEGGVKTVVVPSGQAAIAAVFLSVLKPGDHVLIAETAYPPVNGFCQNFLAPLGMTWSTYPPGIGAGIHAYITAETRLIWMESPGSTTMEIEDVPAIVACAREKGILTGIDNTWATPLLFKPLAHGVDFSMQALTKYPGGHSDILMGSVTVNRMDLRKGLRDVMRMLGFHTAPDAISLVLRGLETMAVRVAHSGRVASEIAHELVVQYPVEVLSPILPESPGHALWVRDFTGASGLFSVVLPVEWESRLDAALNGLRIFAIGASWGGTRSLIAPMTVNSHRTTPHPRNERIILRLSIGLEDPEDLRADLRTFFDLMAQA
ncbi:PLP-dependent aspartate aminotransferase family protein [Thalassospira sp. MCCC 1A01428]|uniref:trans-sulfuration enzyme family protein n=1 Tax=Thalassospira sp. MCCC 1A01428 TaxID=1470575 RepID=UPI000A1EBB37|nr:PLP-dependent transferase [Thalassospira sp. MCCC 1A01428]OSQ39166.1 cystathionine beta-lyase [Thalassospira sp. MCCC 1A01428]